MTFWQHMAVSKKKLNIIFDEISKDVNLSLDAKQGIAAPLNPFHIIFLLLEPYQSSANILFDGIV